MEGSDLATVGGDVGVEPGAQPAGGDGMGAGVEAGDGGATGAAGAVDDSEGADEPMMSVLANDESSTGGAGDVADMVADGAGGAVDAGGIPTGGGGGSGDETGGSTGSGSVSPCSKPNGIGRVGSVSGVDVVSSPMVVSFKITHPVYYRIEVVGCRVNGSCAEIVVASALTIVARSSRQLQHKSSALAHI